MRLLGLEAGLRSSLGSAVSSPQSPRTLWNVFPTFSASTRDCIFFFRERPISGFGSRIPPGFSAVGRRLIA